MAKLSTKSRNKLPKSDFGLPGREAYPMPDKAHAANAKARATQMENKGKLSSSSKAKIDAKANRILDSGKRGGKPTIRGLRITVYDVLSQLAEGATESEILEDFPELELADIRACLAFAAGREHNTTTLIAQ